MLCILGLSGSSYFQQLAELEGKKGKLTFQDVKEEESIWVSVWVEKEQISD